MSTVQGRAEERIEAYLTYVERVPQVLTPEYAKSTGGVACSAGKQVGAPGLSS
ncbi:MAG TPA: hypothetical protein VIK37_03485 [Candidatus Saccharimonadales bacterium]